VSELMFAMYVLPSDVLSSDHHRIISSALSNWRLRKYQYFICSTELVASGQLLLTKLAASEW
jgi:hypothetical protein